MNNAVRRQWLIESLPAAVETSVQRLMRCDGVAHVALMPDVHLADDVCVGCVVGTDRKVFPQALGGDIGCGMAAVAFDAPALALQDRAAASRVMASLYRQVPTHRHARPIDLPPGLGERALSHPSLDAMRRRDARVQIGTLGRGNHFLEFQADQANGRLWVMLHTGSRGIGQAIADHHRAVARGDNPANALAWLDADSPAGRACLDDMAWALDYARANRDAILAATIAIVANVLHAPLLEGSHLDCQHNFVRRETHAGRELFVHRKGAIPAAFGESGIIPGSMGTVSYHVEGRGCDEALCSSSHGAGRAMSRHAARSAISSKQFEREMQGVWFDRRRSDTLRDESPGAYKDIGAVMRAQRELTRITRTMRPVMVYKGG